MPIAQNRLEVLQVCKLLQCVREGDKVQIEKLTLNGIPHLVNYNDPSEGDTALAIAACANNDEMIKFLLELGAHPDVMDFKGRSAVMRAAEYGHVQCMENLAKEGADMKLKDLEGKGILFYVISAPTQRHSRCLEIALEYGADVNNMSKDGKPVFLVACETAAENEDMCLKLLEKGADPNAVQEKEGKTALMAACGSGSVKVVSAILAKGGDVNARDRHRSTALHQAAKGGFFEVLQVLSAYASEFDVVDDKGNTPVHFAADGHAMCCRFLIQRGSNPKLKNNEGVLPKAIAKDNGHKDCGKELRKGEKSFGKTGKNNDPWAIQLYDWSFSRQKEIVEMMQKFDPDISGFVQKDDFIECLQNSGAPLPDEAELKKLTLAHDKNKDNTVDYNDFLTGKKYINKLYLMSAFEGGKKKKKKGGKKGKKGKTKIPMPICVQPEGPRTAGGGPPEVFIPKNIHFTDNTRFDRDKPPEHPLQDDSAWYLHLPDKTYVNVNEAAKYGDLDTLRNAFSKGSPVDTRDKYFKTPLMTACSHGNMEVAIFLLDQGADINARDNFKWTPLHHACHAGQLDLVEYLLSRGAELDATTMNGGTPLTRAIESSKVELVKFLIDRGAKIQTENKKGQNPLDLAMAWADLRVLDTVQTKWDSLPAPSDKKGKGKGGKGGKKSPPPKRAASAPADKEGDIKTPPSTR
ncbi:ankyrin repeat and EF-hand domain-containing protein 1 isoform X2 [Lingula anatina]|uniref:Ankyrin repeat and EF-hand domain-containing protein 1 isoform X2 n=1 Tax=Lingula anatina TaxID=7574 RepID=A0A1S3J7U6_LINAN|nr:ankyrin repeat and EF-hand domain-containing protein 1 isoform X2 [Lingula anatina]|eukprot:XP_013406383.1 ankyrin repeat and EF-hand domain-containing protein 1 isoform X2 [Lingula anatina]